jgi:AraC family transcriptional regulator
MSETHVTALHLGAPPRVEGIGVGIHGTRRRRERWLLPELHSLHLYRYEGELAVDGTPFALRPGFVSVVPPGALMEFTFRGPSEHLYVHFALDTAGEPRNVPLVQDLGIGAPAMFDRVRSASILTNPAQQSAELWGALWRLATLSDSPRQGDPSVNRAVQEAVSYVESHLASPLTVPRIADLVQFSPSQLDRLFKAALGCTVSGFVTERRMSAARHLLEETSQSISLVASSVGIPDLHAFNKACRRWLGASPRAIRYRPDSIPEAGRTPPRSLDS